MKMGKSIENIEHNFCDLCGLRYRIVEFSEDEKKETEMLFKRLSNLGLRDRKKYRRNIVEIIDNVPISELRAGYTEFCSAGSRKWIKKGRGCKDFQLALEKITLSDHISLYTAQKIARSQNRLLCFGIAVSILGLIFILYGETFRSLISIFFNFTINFFNSLLSLL
ncbi:MAG: hypothetical protein Q8O91_05655 [Candidatus Aminicenantes bacterium]|nr:hypothetical protein [Candidatus Aminicenantes bacterium]